MNIFKRKTKEEKLQELQDKVDELNKQWEDVINCYCKIGNYIFVFKGFKHDGESVCIRFVDEDTPQECLNYMKYDSWILRYDKTDFNVARYQFIKFKDELSRLGLELKLINP